MPRKTLSPPVGRRERRSAETREKLFRAALRLFSEHGFVATTVEDITEAADVGKGTFFNYFPSKEHILAHLGEIQVAKMTLLVNEAPASPKPMQQVLYELTQALSEEPGRSQAMFRNMLIANLSHQAVRNLMEGYLEAARRTLAELMKLGQSRGELRRDLSAMELAATFQRSFFGTLMMWSVHPPSPLQEWFETTFRVLWSGIGVGAPPPKSPRKGRREARTNA
jgi:AcrR family transcriptional regulator